MRRTSRAFVRRAALIAIAALLSAPACTRSEKDRVLAETTAGGRSLLYECTTVRPGFDDRTGLHTGCVVGFHLRVPSEDDLGADFSSGPADEVNCVEARATCANANGAIAARVAADATIVAMGSTHTDTARHTLYIVTGSKRPLWWKDAAGDLQTALNAMPPLDAAIDARLQGATAPAWAPLRDDPTGALRVRTKPDNNDGLWDLMSDPARVKTHWAALEALLRKPETCAAPSVYATVLTNQGHAGFVATYEAGAAGCDHARAIIDIQKPAALRATILADLASDRLPSATTWIAKLAADGAVREAAPLIESRLPKSTDTLITWMDLVDDIAALDAPRATRLLLSALATATGAAYGEGHGDCAFPGSSKDSTGWNWSGETDFFALAIAQRLRNDKSAPAEAALLAIARDAKSSGSSRQMAIVLLTMWGSHVPPDLAKLLVLTDCQKKAMADAPISATQSNGTRDASTH